MDKPKILIVDDDPAWLEELTGLLSGANYAVETASSFDHAREKLASRLYAVIVIDLELEAGGVPQTFEGFGLLSGIRFLESLPQRQGKAVVVSAYGTRERVRRAFKCGAYDFVSKQDLDKDEFLSIIQQAIELWLSRRISVPELQLSSEEEKQYERLVHQFIKAKGIESLRDLAPEEEEEFRKLTRRFMRGEPINFDVSEDAVNPWDRGSHLTEHSQ